MFSPFIDYIISNWYWRIEGDDARVYSSARASYVPATDETYVEWLAGGARAPTFLYRESDLIELFAKQYQAGWPTSNNPK